MSFKTAKKPILLHRGRNRTSRPKTFSSEEAAKAYATTHKIAKYTLHDLSPFSKERKIKIMISR